MTDNKEITHNDVALATFTKLAAKIDAVPENALRTVNVDVPTAITTVEHAYDKFAPFAEASKKLPFFDAACFADIRDYGLALREAHGRYLAAFAPPDGLAALTQQATDARELLLGDAQALAKHGLIEPARVADVARSLGHRGVAFDIRRLLPIFRDNWKAIEGKTAITMEQLEAFGALSNQLIDSVAHQDDAAPKANSPATLTRLRTYTLFFNAYDQIRRAISFLRWQEADVDDFAPSLFAGRGGRPPAVQPAAPPPPNAPQVAPAEPPPAQHVAPGMPGSNPYQS